jgi:hypothetical protein
VSQISWALHFAAALPSQTTDVHLRRLAAFSEAACGVEDLQTVVDLAVSFATAGVLALCAGVARAIPD